MKARKPCPHHWIIAQANGPESPAVCETCGEKKMMRNYLSAEEAVKLRSKLELGRDLTEVHD